jgi:hypothetical protein
MRRRKSYFLTVAEPLAEKKIDVPPIKQIGATFKKAAKHITERGAQYTLKVERKGHEEED